MKLKKLFAALGIALCSSSTVVFAGGPLAGSTTAPGSAASIENLQQLMEAIRDGNLTALPEPTQKGLEAVQKSIDASSNWAKNATASDTAFHEKMRSDWMAATREAYVAALPEGDQARARALILGSGTLPGSKGRLYFFVSRSMPTPLLKAYALDALYTGATLVVKGMRKGDTIKEYLEEAVSEYNSSKNNVLSSLEMNPNLFDMFKVDVVPTVVWTNRVGLDDIGSGCPPPEEVEHLLLEGPYEEQIRVEKPRCAAVPDSAYYKIAGALSLSYVLDRFEEAGLAKGTADSFRTALAERREAVVDTYQWEQGSPGYTYGAELMQALAGNTNNAITPIFGEITFASLPGHVLDQWEANLKKGKVQRGPYGPIFGGDGEDDPVYRQELVERIRQERQR